MSDATATKSDNLPRRYALADLESFSRNALLAVGADQDTAEAATRAMMHATRVGIDSHGIRFLPHYAEILAEGRVNPRPKMTITRRFPVTATLDADYGHGALATYRAMDHAVDLAERNGIGTVGIVRSSHFGSGGAYAVAAAERGYVGLAMCNTDSFVRLHDGASRFHGTNPISCAIPNPGEKPWLLDMATSSIPRNRVVLYQSLRRELPPGVGSTADGEDTTDPAQVEMLAPLGGIFGFKGAALAGLIEIFSAVLTGMQLSFELAPMFEELDKTREMGAFVMALRPDAFVSRETFADGMHRYIDALRSSLARKGRQVMAPGDREWAEAKTRQASGAPLDPETLQAFEALAERYGLKLPSALDG